MDMRVTVDDELTATTIVVDGDKIQMTSVQGADTYEIYASKDGDQYYLYGKVDGEWEKVPSNEYDYNNYKNIPANAIQFYAGTPLESFTYDANEKCYVMALSADGMDGTFKIFFENKKFKKVETVITYADPAETRITQIDVTYNVRVTLPDE